jgi:hypothetical protein
MPLKRKVKDIKPSEEEDSVNESEEIENLKRTIRDTAVAAGTQVSR